MLLQECTSPVRSGEVPSPQVEQAKGCRRRRFNRGVVSRRRARAFTEPAPGIFLLSRVKRITPAAQLARKIASEVQAGERTPSCTISLAAFLSTADYCLSSRRWCIWIVRIAERDSLDINPKAKAYEVEYVGYQPDLTVPSWLLCCSVNIPAELATPDIYSEKDRASILKVPPGHCHFSFFFIQALLCQNAVYYQSFVGIIFDKQKHYRNNA